MNAQTDIPAPQSQGGIHPEFGNALLRALTDQRNEAQNRVAEVQATLSLVAKENEFLSKRVRELEAALAQAGSDGVQPASTATPGAGPGVASQAARQRSRGRSAAGTSEGEAQAA